MSEVPLGDGFLDIPKIVSMVREKKPSVKITLEMITRDPLKVPCLTAKYWATFPERNGWPLARTLRMVAANPPRKPLPRMEGRDAAAQRAYENDNVKLCLAYSKEKLGL